MLAGILCFAVPLGLIALITVLTLRSRRHAAEIAAFIAAMPEAEKLGILALVDGIGTERPATACLTPTGEKLPQQQTLIRLPNDLDGYAFGGLCLRMEKIDHDYLFSFVDDAFEGISFFGRLYRPVTVPRIRSEDGTIQDLFEADELIEASQELGILLRERYGKAPGRLLEAVRGTTYEGDTRVGGSPSWFKRDAPLQCKVCSGDMEFVMQISEDESNDSHSRTIFVFACRDHLDQIDVLEQPQ